MHLTILGGGPAGLAAAFYAHQSGIPFVLFEKSSALGGLCRTFRSGAHSYDSGAHRFHDRDPEITEDLRQLLGSQIQAVDAPSQVYVSGRFIDFPPTPLNLLRSVGLGRLGKIGCELVSARFQNRPVMSFADLAVRNFGESLARKFLLNYSEKVWGLPADRLSPDVATRRLFGMTLYSLLTELVLPGKKVEHIDGRFLYPRRGYGMIAEALAERLPSKSLQTGRAVRGIEYRDSQIRRIHFAGGGSFEPPGRVVSTLPLTLLVKLLGDALPASVHDAAERLRFRQIHLVFLRLRQARFSTNASIYLPDPSVSVSRIHEPKNRSAAMAPPDETSLVAEVPCFPGDRMDRLSPDQLAGHVADELEQIGLLKRRRIIEFKHHLLPSAYPVYSLDYAVRVQTITAAFQRLAGLDILGRSGLFCYSHLHDQMRMAKDYVSHLRNQAQSGDLPAGAGGTQEVEVTADASSAGMDPKACDTSGSYW